MSYQTYFWIASTASFAMLMHIPSKQSNSDNFIGTVICSVLGVVLWPVYAYALYKSLRNGS